MQVSFIGRWHIYSFLFFFILLNILISFVAYSHHKWHEYVFRLTKYTLLERIRKRKWERERMSGKKGNRIMQHRANCTPHNKHTNSRTIYQTDMNGCCSSFHIHFFFFFWTVTFQKLNITRHNYSNSIERKTRYRREKKKYERTKVYDRIFNFTISMVTVFAYNIPLKALGLKMLQVDHSIGVSRNPTIWLY